MDQPTDLRPRPPYQHQTGPTSQPLVTEVASAQPSMVDVIAEDARAALAEQAAQVPDWPAGAPKLRPLMRLGFAQRAEAMELYADIERSLGDMPNQGDQVGPAEAAKMYRVMAKMDKLLAAVADNPDLYRAWVGNNDDAAFGQLFSAYMSRMQPGEASSSSS